MNKSILGRLIFTIIILVMWFVSMFPLKDQDFFQAIEKASKKTIQANKNLDEKDENKLTEDEIKDFQEALETAKLYKKDNAKEYEDSLFPMTRSICLEKASREKNIKLYKFIDTPGEVKPSNKRVIKRIHKRISGKLKAGLDLKGGVEFIVAFDPKHPNITKKNKSPEDIRNRIIEILTNRISYNGLVEAEIRPFSVSAISIRVPATNEEEINQIRTMLKQPATLEFKGVHSQYSNKMSMTRAKSLLTDSDFDFKVYRSNTPGKAWILKRIPEMDGKDIEDAVASQNPNGQFEIHVTFNPKGAKQFGEVTAGYVKKPLAIVLDNVCFSAPVIQEVIAAGVCRISGDFSREEAKQLALVLKSGALPVPIHIDGESITSPSLGAESIKSGEMSAMVGLLLVFIFMIVYYRKAGLIADFALAANILLVFGSMTIMRATFTLPGIAGIILTIGMAVDANVLIYERIREELATGKTLANAIKAGYDRAFITILDANITTLLTAVILIAFGSGAIKGFAITLAIGIIASMFTAIFVTRIFFDWMASNAKGGHQGISMMKILSQTHIDFWSKRKMAMIFSGTLILISAITMIAKGKDGLSVDFTGGTAVVYSVATKNKVSATEIKKRLEKVKFKNPRAVYKSRGDITELDVVVKSSTSKQKKNANVIDPTKTITNAINAGTSDFKIISSSNVGGLVGDNFINQAGWSIFWALLFIFLYISMRFESIFAIGAIVAIIHDSFISVGFFLLLGNQISLPVIAALLTIIGYSLNDTIVVFDRIRENSGDIRKKSIIEIVNYSINGTLSRTILTSVTTLLVVAILVFFGGAGLQDFALVLLIGILIGTYSSIFVASPIVCGGKLSGKLEEIHQNKEGKELQNKEDQTVAVES